jgi:acid phosphatase (class A)
MLRTLLAVTGAALLVGCTTPLPATDPGDLPQVLPGVVAGYLDRKAVVDGVALLPPPPTPASPAQAADDAAYRAAIADKGSPRWQLAAADADLRRIPEAFVCALGTPIDADCAPHLTMLVRRVASDGGFATLPAKVHYRRPRPFVALEGPTCIPADEPALRKDPAYPSGHAALGWTVGLVLIQVAPDRANELAQRAFAYGQSRVLCGVHWPSDVVAARTLAASVVAQLQSNADFGMQLAQARKEYARMRASGAKPDRDCAAEAAALR